ncbi:MAG: SurA N-terminal domain-containing protein [Rhodospirillales bacterium]|nr:SurA N-terminal domain-containing protein [Rhodospirillales bacterium]
MLDFLRRSSSSIVVKLLFGLLIASFAVWGIGDVFRAGSGSAALVTVGNADITVPQFRAEMARELDRVSQALGQQVSREQAVAMGVDQMLLQRMINSQVLLEGAKDLGLMASDAVVLSEIKKNEEFFNEAGQFDRRVYTEVLSRAGMNEDMYVARVRDSIVRMQYLSPISTGVAAPKVLVNTLYKRFAEKRVLDVVRITHAKINGVPAPTTEQLTQYHTDNAERFMAPQYRALTALVLSADALGKGVEITDAELATAYDERAAEFTTPEVRSLSQVLVKDEAAAARAAELLAAGKTITETANEVGANASMIKLGDFTRDEAAALSVEIADAAFNTPQGGHSAPIKSPLGWHVLVVDAITPGAVRTLDEVKDELTQLIRNERTLNVLFETSNQLEDQLGGGQTLEEAATGLGLNLVKIAAVDANGFTPDGAPVDTPYVGAILPAAFDLSEGADSAMIETEDNKAFFVVRADAITPSALRPLDTVRQQVTAAWMQEQRAAQAETVAASVKARLQAGEDAGIVARALGFDAFTTEPFNRTGQGLENGALPATLMNDAFTLNVGDVISALGTDAHTVARVKSVTQVEVDAANSIYSAIQGRALQDMQTDLASQLATALQETYPVRVNNAALQDLAN